LQIGDDLEQTIRTILGAASSPNVGAVLFVSLGCEQTPSKSLAGSVVGKPSALVSIQESEDEASN
jgi:altronate dehydratase large subunit